jgi:hypothetical protein
MNEARRGVPSTLPSDPRPREGEGGCRPHWRLR